MENGCVTPHSQLIETLFSHKNTLRCVFRDVLGLLEIHHVSLQLLSTDNQLIILSSDPAIAFNLFNSNLWQYDKTYQLSWWQSAPPPTNWQALYAPARFDELYYVKQKKPGLISSLTLNTPLTTHPQVISFASKATIDWADALDTLHDIGQYCLARLKHVLPFDIHLQTEEHSA